MLLLLLLQLLLLLLLLILVLLLVLPLLLLLLLLHNCLISYLCQQRLLVSPALTIGLSPGGMRQPAYPHPHPQLGPPRVYQRHMASQLIPDSHAVACPSQPCGHHPGPLLLRPHHSPKTPPSQGCFGQVPLHPASLVTLSSNPSNTPACTPHSNPSRSCSSMRKQAVALGMSPTPMLQTHAAAAA